MSDPQSNLTPRTQRLDRFIAESDIQLNVNPHNTRIEQLKVYQYWTLKDLDMLSDITQFSEIMCAVEWIQTRLTVELEDLASSLYLYDLEDLTAHQLLRHLGVDEALLVSTADERTVAEYVQTAYNAFHFQSEYQNDPKKAGRLRHQLQNFAKRQSIPLMEPYPLCHAAIALRMVLLARGYQTVTLGLTLRSKTTVGGIALDALSETLSLRVQQTADHLSVALWPATEPSTVLKIPDRAGDGGDEYYIGGLNALQMQALETALRDRTQAILAEGQSETVTTLKALLSGLWSTYLLPFEVYTARSQAERAAHYQCLQPLANCLSTTLGLSLQGTDSSDMTQLTTVQAYIKDYLHRQLEDAVYAHDRLAFLAQDVAPGILQAQTEMAYGWDKAPNDAAKADGWLIYDVGHDHFPERDRYRLQAFDQSGRFETDEQAWVHVVQQLQAEPSGLSAQALAFLQRHAPREHRLVWVSAYQTMIKEALQTPDAFLQWIQIQEARRVIGWRPVEAFLGSLGVQRSQVTGDHVWLYDWDEEYPIAVLGLDSQGQPLADPPMPQWLVDFDAEMTEIARNTDDVPMAMGVFHYVGRVILLTGNPLKIWQAGTHRPIVYGLLTGTFIAAYTVWDKYAVSQLFVSPVLLNYGCNAFETILLLSIALTSWHSIQQDWNRYWRKILGAAILNPIAYILVLIAMTFTPLSHVAPTRELSILVGVVMGHRLLAEGAATRRLVAASIMILGIVTLALN